jgi:hypothetical protein
MLLAQCWPLCCLDHQAANGQHAEHDKKPCPQHEEWQAFLRNDQRVDRDTKDNEKNDVYVNFLQTGGFRIEHDPNESWAGLEKWDYEVEAWLRDNDPRYSEEFSRNKKPIIAGVGVNPDDDDELGGIE